jgi:hypothetical protein
VAAPDYASDYIDALREWLLVDAPPTHHYDAMEQWAKALEHKGPPGIVAYTDDGLLVAEGPNDERIAHDVVQILLGLGPPHSIIAIKYIVSRPSDQSEGGK